MGQLQPFFEHVVDRSFGRVGCSCNSLYAESLLQQFADECLFFRGDAIGFRACCECLVTVFAAKSSCFAFVGSPVDDGLDLLAKRARR